MWIALFCSTSKLTRPTSKTEKFSSKILEKQKVKTSKSIVYKESRQSDSKSFQHQCKLQSQETFDYIVLTREFLKGENSNNLENTSFSLFQE